MNVSRRFGNWRLVAMLSVAWVLAAGLAWAEVDQIRVKVGPAPVYQRPQTSSAVMMTAPEGTVLEVIKRDGDWYWVVLPRDQYGTRRGGYIAAYLVELVPRKGTAQPASPWPPAAWPPPAVAPAAPAAKPPAVAPGAPAAPPPAVAPGTAVALPPAPPTEPSAAPTGPPAARFSVSLGAGAQASSSAFGDTAWFPMNDETTTYRGVYSTPRASALDVSIGVRLSRSAVLGVAYWRSTPLPTASIAATVPHPLDYRAPRPASAGGFAAGRLENDLHLQAALVMPVSRRADLSIFGGPSLFFLRQDLVTLDVGSFRDTYPFDTVNMTGSYHTVRRSKMGVGGNVGFDLSVMVWRYFGVGATARYARGSLELPATMDGYATLVKVGGVQASGGLRLRF